MKTIKGIWYFDTDTLYYKNPIDATAAPYEDTHINVTFTDKSNNEYTEIRIYVFIEDMGFSHIDTVKYGDKIVYTLSDGWVDEVYRTINFGETEVEVSDGFYSLLTINTIENRYISGTWLFNEKVNMPIGNSYILIDTSISRPTVFVGSTLTYGIYVSTPIGFNLGSIDADGLYFYDAIPEGSIYSYDTETWVNEEYRTVRFTEKIYVDADSYIWFITNAEQQQEEAAFTISGKWIFNETLVVLEDTPTYIRENINFTSGNGVEDFIEIQYIKSNDPLIEVYYSHGYYMVHGLEWDNEAFRTIDFGTEPQEVSSDFYFWFTSNAIQQKEGFTKTVKGKWIFNENIGIDVFISEYVNFASNGMGYDSFIITPIEITYHGVNPYYEYHDIIWNLAWDDEVYRTVDFGTAEQIVSDEFYDWFTANATQLPSEEENSHTISGKWIFNERPSMKAGNLKANIDFTTYNRQGTSIECYYDGKAITEIYFNIYFDYNNLNYYLVYTGDDEGNFGWDNEAFRTIDFGTEPQEVSQEFYDWFTASAIKYTSEPEISSITFNLSSLNLSTGTHIITVKLNGNGYKESEESNAISYVVGD